VIPCSNASCDRGLPHQQINDQSRSTYQPCDDPCDGRIDLALTWVEGAGTK
jgi:hypothetical protein